MKKRRADIIITTGGTGGHIFPARSLYLSIEKDSKYKPLVITDIQSYKSDMWHSCNVKAVRGGKIAGLGFLSIIRSAIQLFIGICHCFLIMLFQRPKLVVGFGGFASVPALSVAFILRVPIVIHEQNAVIGRANKLFIPLAKKVALTFDIEKYTGKKFIRTGNPIRDEFIQLRNQKPKKKDDSKLKVFVVGGSGGARVFSEVVPEAFSKLPHDIQNRFEVIQQCRAELIMWTQQSWNKASKVKVSLSAFYNNIAEIMFESDFIISRAGSSSIAEISCLGKKALFVPIAKSIDGHQFKNAKWVADRDAAWLFTEKEFNSDALSKFLINMCNNNIDAEKIEANSFKIGMPDSSERLKKIVEDIIK